MGVGRDEGLSTGVGAVGSSVDPQRVLVLKQYVGRMNPSVIVNELL